jgi:hypothetical protein
LHNLKIILGHFFAFFHFYILKSYPACFELSAFHSRAFHCSLPALLTAFSTLDLEIFDDFCRALSSVLAKVEDLWQLLVPRVSVLVFAGEFSLFFFSPLRASWFSSSLAAPSFRLEHEFSILLKI